MVPKINRQKQQSGDKAQQRKTAKLSNLSSRDSINYLMLVRGLRFLLQLLRNSLCGADSENCWETGEEYHSPFLHWGEVQRTHYFYSRSAAYLLPGPIQNAIIDL